MMSLIRRIFEETSIHGFPYVVQRKFHWLERLLWSVILILATYASINICLNQWERFRDNPIIYTVERKITDVQFTYPAVTMCSNYKDENKNAEIIQHLWQVTPDGERYEYYLNFINLLAKVRYDNMEILKPYENDTTLKNIPLLNITRDMRATLAPNSVDIPLDRKEQNKKKNTTLQDMDHISYATATTEMGLCLTSSLLNEYTNVYGKLQRVRVSDVKTCRLLDVCTLKVNSIHGDGSVVSAYMHNVNDILVPFNKNVIKMDLIENVTLSIDVDMPLTMAEHEVRNLPISFRKCRYTDESNLKYFAVYRPVLCQMECRIDAALKLCKCKPFFYAVARLAPICDIKGMMCLAKTNWTEAQCECFPLCEDIEYAKSENVGQLYDKEKFERVLLVSVHLPIIAVKRRVVFSTDQLVVSFGGAVSLFLGCSFLSFVEIFYFCMEFCFKELRGKIRRMFR